MKLAPRGGMMTSLVEVNGRTVAAGWEGGAAAALVAPETSAGADSANAGIPARAKDAVAAPFNKLRREILSMIEYLSAVRVKNYSARPCHYAHRRGSVSALLAARQSFLSIRTPSTPFAGSASRWREPCREFRDFAQNRLYNPRPIYGLLPKKTATFCTLKRRA